MKIKSDKRVIVITGDFKITEILLYKIEESVLKIKSGMPVVVSETISIRGALIK